MKGINKKLFHYSKKIDKDVCVAVSKVLGIKVKKAVKMKHGEVNHVYKIISDKGAFLARVFKNKDWPSQGKLPWVETQLRKHGIAHAKIIYYSRSKKYFPYGFMVTEFLDGLNGNQAVKSRKISFAKAFYETGKALRKVHRIKIKKFGSINNGRGQKSDFLNWKLGEVKGRLKRLRTAGVLKDDYYEQIKAKAFSSLLLFVKKFTPVLNHADANRENAIWTPNQEWVLVDWDNAYSGSWVEDYAELTYWVDWQRGQAQAKKVRDIINQNFFKGYGSHQFSQTELAVIEKALHTIKTTLMLEYYFFNKKSLISFKKTLKKLKKLLA